MQLAETHGLSDWYIVAAAGRRYPTGAVLGTILPRLLSVNIYPYGRQMSDIVLDIGQRGWVLGGLNPTPVVLESSMFVAWTCVGWFGSSSLQAPRAGPRGRGGGAGRGRGAGGRGGRGGS